MSLFKKKVSEFDEQENQGSGKSKGSLLVLLVLLGGFAYLYFFTSLIVPHEVPSAKAPEVSTEVKQSMPLKPVASPSNQAAPDAKKPEEAKPAVSPVPPAAKPTAPPVAPPVAAPAPVKPAAPVTAAPAPAKPVAPVPAPQPQAAAKPAILPPTPAASKKEAAVPVKKDEPKPAKAAEQKPAPAVQKKDEAGSTKAPAPEKPAVRTTYTIFAGEFPSGEEAAAAEAKLARLGIKPVTRQETKKSKSMNRLFFGVYTDYDVYSAELDKLRQSAKGAFGVEKEGKYYLYAGSFSSKERVEKEKKALSAKGITLQAQLVVLPLSTVRLTAGRFTAKGEADKATARMKGEGLTGKVVPLGR